MTQLLQLPKMTFQEFAICVLVDAWYVKLLPDGGYLAVRKVLIPHRVLTRSAPGDYEGFCEEWTFDNGWWMGANLMQKLKNPDHEIAGWTRHLYLKDGDIVQELARSAQPN